MDGSGGCFELSVRVGDAALVTPTSSRHCSEFLEGMNNNRNILNCLVRRYHTPKSPNCCEVYLGAVECAAGMATLDGGHWVVKDQNTPRWLDGGGISAF